MLPTPSHAKRGRRLAPRTAEETGTAVLAACAASGIASTLFAWLGPPAGARAHGAALLCASLAPALFTGFGYLALPRRLGVATSVSPGLARGAAWSAILACLAAIASCDGVPFAGPPMAALAWFGLACASLDLTATILVGRDRRIHLAALSPLPVALLASGLALVMVLPIEAGIATKIALQDPAAGHGSDLAAAMIAPAVPLLLALGLGIAADVTGAGSTWVRSAIVAEGWLGCLVWAHVLLGSGAWAPHGAGQVAWLAAIAAPALVPIVPILRGAIRSLASGRRGVGAVASLHAIGIALLVPLGLVQLATGPADAHGGLSLACLFAVFCGFCAWSEQPTRRPAISRARGFAAQFAMLAFGGAGMLAAPVWPQAGAVGETVAALASVWFALIVIVGSVRARVPLRAGGVGA